jgi:hypothetical protein
MLFDHQVADKLEKFQAHSMSCVPHPSTKSVRKLETVLVEWEGVDLLISLVSGLSLALKKGSSLPGGPTAKVVIHTSCRSESSS